MLNFTEIGRLPYVAIVGPFAAIRFGPQDIFLSIFEAGKQILLLPCLLKTNDQKVCQSQR